MTRKFSNGWRSVFSGAVLLLAGQGHAAEWYVDAVNGNDTNSGAYGSPMQTLAAVAEAAGPGDIIYAFDGTYDYGKQDTPGAERDCRVVLNGESLIALAGATPVIDGINANGNDENHDSETARGVFMMNGAVLEGFTVRGGRSAVEDDAAANHLNNAGGGIYMTSNCVVRECTIYNCEATRGGGIYCREDGIVERCKISGNDATKYGGGIYFFRGGEADNAYFYYNDAGENGGGLYFYQGGAAVNCTTYDNMAGASGNEMDFSGGGTVLNCIVWNLNGAIDRPENATAIEYTCAFDGVTNGVDGCITNEPLFAGNFSDALVWNSPCVDAGNNAYTNSLVDRSGAVRVAEGRVDMGSTEFHPACELAIDDLAVTCSYNVAPNDEVRALDASGNVPVEWLVEPGADWLTLSETNGMLEVAGSTNLTFSINPAGLAPGIYSATNLYTADYMLGTITQLVSLTVIDSNLSIDDVDFGAVYGGAADVQVLSLTNSGVATAEWSAVAGADWMSISEMGGLLEGQSSINLTFTADPAGLMPGVYTATNRFSSPTMADVLEQEVALTVQASELSIPEHAFTAQSNAFDDPEKDLLLSNTGTIAAEWSVAANASWLSIFPTSGSLGSGDTVSLNYQVDSAGLPEGIYTATNLFSAPFMVGSYTQLVTFLVTDFDFYVSPDGSDSNNGTSWATAKQTIQAAVDAQTQYGGTVWVSNGTYSVVSEVVVDKPLYLKGFSGAENTMVDGGDSVRCFNLSNCSLDGFTIQNGYADGLQEETGLGGGVIAEESEIVNCVFNSNAAKLGGGGLAARNCWVGHCTFSANEAEVIWLGDYEIYGGSGGGAAVESSDVYNCLFSDNLAHYGGGLALTNSTVSACELFDNEASCHGGGAFIADSGLTEMSFAGNHAVSNGGAIYFEGGGSLIEYIGCTNNTAGAYGGGIYVYDKSDTDGLEDPECWYVSLHGNSAGLYGGGAYFWHGGLITRSTISGNHADVHGGGVSFRLSGGVYRSEIFGNTAVENGGGVYFSEGGYLRETAVHGNHAERGAGIYHYKGGDAKSVLLAGNEASVRGGGVYCYKGGTLNGITASDNRAVEYGSGFYAYNDQTNTATLIQLENAIVWEETDPMYRSGSNIVVRYLCSNEANTAGIKNLITSDPLFMDVASSNYSLMAESPCINAGTNTNERSIDAAWNPRIVNATVDLGAYEYIHSTTNYDGDAFSNDDEAIADTDPLDDTDWFHISGISSNTVRFQSSENRQYTLYWSSNLVDGAWAPVKTRMGVGGEDSMSGTNSALQQFFKLEVKLP